MRYILLIICSLASFLALAQNKYPEISSGRPDQTESPSTVPIRTLQIETGFVMENDFDGDIHLRSFVYNSLFLRYGLFKNLELRLGLDYLGEKRTIANASSESFSGFGPFYTGFKVKVREEEGWKPETAILGGLAFPFTAGNIFKPSYTAGSIRLAFAHTLSDRFSLGYNLGAEWDRFSARAGYFYSASLGISITEKLAMFVENYGMFHEKSVSEHLMDAGFTLLVSPNVQLDLSGGIGLNKHAPDNFISAGVSWRLPR